MPKKVALYSRVSTTTQDVAPQLDALEEVCRNHGWEIVGRYEDNGISGAKGPDGRPQLHAMLKAAGRKEFEGVVLWSVDRLGRSLKDLVLILQELQHNGIDLYSHSQVIDTSTPMGRMMWQFLSVFSEFEREMIRERVRMGLDRARRSGKRLGRTANYTGKDDEIRQLRAGGMGILKIARQLHIGTASVYKALELAPSSN